MSDLGREAGLFDITRTLLQQPDLAASLGEALSHLVSVQRSPTTPALCYGEALSQRAILCDARNSRPVEYEDETVLAHGPVRRILSRPDAYFCNFHEFTRETAAACRERPLP